MRIGGLLQRRLRGCGSASGPSSMAISRNAARSRPPERLVTLALDLSAGEADVAQHAVVEPLQRGALARPLGPGEDEIDERDEAAVGAPERRGPTRVLPPFLENCMHTITPMTKQ